jgi:hypothetical protein
MHLKVKIDGNIEVITDEYNESYDGIARDVQSWSKSGNLRLFMRKYRLSVDEDHYEHRTPVMRWAVFEFNPTTKEYVLKLKWETDKGEYVPPDGSRFQDNPSDIVRRRGTLRRHIEYQRIAARGKAGTARHRKEQGEAHQRGVQARLEDAVSYPLKHDREVMKRIASEIS